MKTRYLDEFLDELPSHNTVGADLSIHIGGREVYRRRAGFSDRDAGLPMRADAIYRMYSCTKVITCAAALMLYERGKYLLTDRLSDYLPEFGQMNVRRADGSVTPAVNAIKIRDLFCMTAGMTYDLDSPGIRRCADETGGEAETREAMKYIAADPLAAEPGEIFNYSICHDILGALIEAVSGMRFGEFLAENIFRPLGMDDTGFSVPPEKLQRVPPLYRRDADGAINRTDEPIWYRIGSKFESGGAGLYSTVDDYLRFADGLLEGRIISKYTLGLMTTQQLTPAQKRGLWHTRFGYGYGLGVRVLDDIAGGGANAPAGEFGWSGAAGAHFISDKTLGMNLFMAQHLMNPPSDWYRNRLRAVLYASL